MKQELYKNMYRQICMGEEQKNRIWQNLEAEETKKEKIRELPKRFPVRVAVCAGVVLMSGMTVLAAGEFSVVDRIADAMKYFTKDEQELTEEQKNIYAQYGSELDNEITMTYGTLKLDAALYDESYLFVPFRYIYNQDMDGYRELTSGTHIYKTSLWKAGKLEGYYQDMQFEKMYYRIAQDTRAVDSWITMYNPVLEEDGVLSGSILLSAGLDKTFAKGDIIQVVRLEKTDGGTDDPKVLSEFSLENPVNQRELAVDEATDKSLENMGLTIEKMSVSPISLQYSGIGTHRDVTHVTVEVVLKNGSVVQESDSGAQVDFEYSAAMKEYTSYDVQKLFAAPVLLEEIAGVRIRYKTEEVWIAAE